MIDIDTDRMHKNRRMVGRNYVVAKTKKINISNSCNLKSFQCYRKIKYHYIKIKSRKFTRSLILCWRGRFFLQTEKKPLSKTLIH